MTPRKFKIAFWASLTVAMIGMVVLIMPRVWPYDKQAIALLPYVEGILSSSYLLAYLTVIVRFRFLLNQYAHFDKANRIITVLMATASLFTLLNLATLPFPHIHLLVSLILELMLEPPLGILYIAFGLRLLQCKEPFFGFLKPFAYLMIATGITTLTIIFNEVAILTSTIAYLLLATIFSFSFRKIGTLNT